MVIGFLIEIKGRARKLKYLAYISHIFIAVGLLHSFNDFGSISPLFAIALGFLRGRYCAAKEMRLRCYWVAPGNLSCAVLGQAGLFGFDGTTIIVAGFCR